MSDNVMETSRTATQVTREMSEYTTRFNAAMQDIVRKLDIEIAKAIREAYDKIGLES